MFKIKGKQQFGGVWADGKCIAKFTNGVATTNDPAVAEILKAKGYTVEGEQDQPKNPEGDNAGEPETPVEGEQEGEKPKSSRRKRDQ